MSDLPIVSAETNTLDDAIIVKETKEKIRILDAYKERFGQDFDNSIVSKKKGKIKLDPTLDYPCMKPALDKWYHVSELSIMNVITGGQGASPLFPRPEESRFNQQKLLNNDTKSIKMAANQLFSSPRATLKLQTARTHQHILRQNGECSNDLFWA
jgi:hypothetical protein